MMNRAFINHVLIIIGWFFIVLGGIGLFLPILPTTPFLIVALALFSKSSPRFHQMLLDNPWFGPTLREWQATKTLSRKIKYKASFLIIISFSVSILIFAGNVGVQTLLACVALILLFCVWRIKEKDVGN